MVDANGKEILSSVPPIRFDGLNVSVGRMLPADGADIRAVLDTVGFSEEEIEACVADDVVSAGDSD